jgi:uncharacterized membrane protein YhaH (DUF805 family)
MKYYVDALKKYFVFSGRARRMEFWWFTFHTIFICIVLFLLDVSGISDLFQKAFVNNFGEFWDYLFAHSPYWQSNHLNIYGWGFLYFAILSIMPLCSACVRRLHDAGYGGQYIFLVLIPIFGIIVLCSFLIKDGDVGNNKYGTSPKTATHKKMSFRRAFAIVALVCAILVIGMYFVSTRYERQGVIVFDKWTGKRLKRDIE